ncbi:FxsA family protein [Oceanobacillus sp. 1P07AA]|uniref:FxsA family protein n=1 Tax=Oceanobacillus sp. 1P07AA TaxID=3132293 RepID=UPI0039A5B529
MQLRFFLLLLIVIPALEIGTFIWLGNLIGPWWVAGLIIATGLFGFYFVRQQGAETFKKAQLQMQQGYAPAEELMDSIALFIGAILLIFPGFILDAVGLILVLPWTRNLIKHQLKRLMTRMMGKGAIIYRRW